ncbi:MAG TPA: pyridoxamine 5'-phosphate oxidase family protein [Aggregatilineales bacterium]|nr:pyridoxamine 5'-phosphate oxidase family protein [Aggregatilineales bacterium]
MAQFDIPQEVEAVFHEFRTTEFTTIARDGTPITWPITAVYRPVPGEFLAATSIGLPQKAFNLRRNPRAALFFSEPRGSGLSNPPAVLVQGDANVAEKITTLEGIEDLWAKIFRFQPAAKQTSSGPLMHYLMDWYYMRIPLVISPRRIMWWPNGDFSHKPLELSHVG